MDEQRTGASRYVLLRGICLFFGLFALLNVAACLMGGRSSANFNIWWVDLTSLAFSYNGTLYHFGFILEALAGLAVVFWALKPRCSLVRRVLTVVLTALLAVCALLNAVTYWHVLLGGGLHFALPVPLSLVVALIFGLASWRIAAAKPRERTGALGWTGVIVCAVAAALVFPLLQIVFFGTTDYRREADAAVVFGARVYEGGRLSMALRERMDTAVELYEDGSVKAIVCSGGIEEGGEVDEAQAMCNYAKSKGVPADAILVDRYGDTTENSVTNTIKLAQQYGFDSIIATSSFYHLPRIKMLFNMQSVDVLTVPTIGDVLANGTLVSIWREVPAWWFYLAKGALAGV